jgi:hypothetical protein
MMFEMFVMNFSCLKILIPLADLPTSSQELGAEAGTGSYNQSHGCLPSCADSTRGTDCAGAQCSSSPCSCVLLLGRFISVPDFSNLPLYAPQLT